MFLLPIAALLSSQTPPLTATLQSLATKWKISIVCDAFQNDFAPPVSEAPSAEAALQDFTQKTNRTVTLVSTIYVLRRKQASEWRKAEAFAPPPAEPINPSRPLRFSKAAPSMVEAPPRYVLSASAIPAGELARAVSTRTKQSIRVSPELTGRRVYVEAHEKSLVELFDALAFCINATPDITVRQTPAQAEAEALGLSDADAYRYALSKELYDQLIGTLTDKEKMAIAGGEFLELPMSRLPSALRDQALDYLKLAFDQMKSVITDAEINWNNSSSFALKFRPEGNGPRSLLGAMVIGNNGIHYNF